MAAEKRHLKIGIISEDGELATLLTAAIIRRFRFGEELDRSAFTTIDNAHMKIEAPDRTYTLICFSNILEWYSLSVTQMAHKTQETDGLIFIEDTKNAPDKSLLSKHMGLGGMLGCPVVFYLNDDDNPNAHSMSKRQERWADALDALLKENGLAASLSRPYSIGSVQQALDDPYGVDGHEVADAWFVFAEADFGFVKVRGSADANGVA